MSVSRLYLLLCVTLISGFFACEIANGFTVADVATMVQRNAGCAPNQHSKWIETRTTATDRVVMEQEFWSRDGKYFRVDSVVTESTNLDRLGNRAQFIVGPAGFTLSRSKKFEPLIFSSAGTTQEGIDLLYQYQFYEAALRCGLPYLSSYMDARGPTRPGWELLSIAQDAGEASIVFKINSNGLELQKRFLFDTVKGVCVEAQKSIVTGKQDDKKSDGTSYSSTSYEDSCVPTMIKYFQLSDTEELTTTETARKEISLDSPPLEVFDFPVNLTSQSSFTIWRRWVLLLLTGLGLIATFIGYHYYQKKQTT